MKIIQKVIDAICFVLTGFSVGQGLLFLMIMLNNKQYAALSYHYSDNTTWYVLVFGLPTATGLAFYFWIRGKIVAKAIKILLRFIVFAQITFTMISLLINMNYWGYVIKRPTLFKELVHADSILQCSRVSNYDTTGYKTLFVIQDRTFKAENLLGRSDPYYGNIDRPFMAFQDQSNLYDIQSVYFDTVKHFNSIDLETIYAQIQQIGFIDRAAQLSRYDQLGRLCGVALKFKTTDNKTYIFTGLQGWEVSNDHFPYYEFLFVKQNDNFQLLKKQKYYIDVAGIEGLEYACIAPLFSLALTLFGIISRYLLGYLYLRNQYT